MGLLFFWFVMAIVVALVASSKGKSGGAWFFYGLLIWPVALVHALVSSPTRDAVIEKAATEGRRPCPHCAEMIMAEAKVCRFCSRDVAPLSAAEAAPSEQLFGMPLAAVVREAPPYQPPKPPASLVDPDARHFLG